jgi:ribosome-binding protein aMBF1 (putative translation factor)
MADLDTGFYARWHAEQMGDPEYRREYERTRAEIEQVDAIMRELDGLRIRSGMKKSQLARMIGKDPSTVRRLFSAEVNPELKTVVALAIALDAEITLRPRKAAGGRSKRPSPSAV